MSDAPETLDEESVVNLSAEMSIPGWVLAQALREFVESRLDITIRPEDVKRAAITADGETINLMTCKAQLVWGFTEKE